MAITKEQIFAAADNMFAAGKQPTLVGVRKILGAGSYSTISAALSDWKADHQDEPETAAGSPVPASVSELVDDLAERVWAVAAQRAGEVFQEDRAALDLAVKVAKDEAREAIDLANEFEGQLNLLQTDRDDARRMLGELEIEHQKLRLADAVRSTREEALVSRVSDLQAELERLQALNQGLVAAFADKTAPAKQPAAKTVPKK